MKRQTKIPVKSVVGAKGRTYNDADRAAYVEARAKAIARPKDMMTWFEMASVVGTVLRHNEAQISVEHFELAQTAVFERWPTEVKPFTEDLLPLAYAWRGVAACYAVGDAVDETDVKPNLQRVLDGIELWECDPFKEGAKEYVIVTREDGKPVDWAIVDMVKLLSNFDLFLGRLRENSPETLDDLYQERVE